MSVFAQKFGHLKSADVLTVMPEFTKAQTDIQAMQKQYEDEMKRATDELTKNILNTNRNKPTFLRTFRKDARKNCRNYRKKECSSNKTHNSNCRNHTLIWWNLSTKNWGCHQSSRPGRWIYLYLWFEQNRNSLRKWSAVHRCNCCCQS